MSICGLNILEDYRSGLRIIITIRLFIYLLRMRITTAGFGDIIIDLEYLCECNCTKIANSSNCNFQGTYECGKCLCNPGWFGHLCQCDISKPSQNETATCLDPKTTDGTLCNGFGQCICGACECFTQPVSYTIP